VKKQNKLTGHPLFYKLTEEEVSLHDAKSRDYRSNDDPLANFKRVSAIMRLYPDMDWSTPTAVAIIYSLKQMDAALSLLERGVEGAIEDFDSRATDIHVYWKLARILKRET
jgi:hypothetical protein